MNKQAYINRVATSLQGMDLKGLFPSVIIAQAALEGGWGESLLAKQYNNHFGMKPGVYRTNYGGWNGQTVTLPTKEWKNGKYQVVNQEFRVYPSLEYSILDHNGLFYKLSRYKAVLTAKSPYEQLIAIKNGGYATEPEYVSRLMKVINDNNLTRFDGNTGQGSVHQTTPGSTQSATTTQTSKIYKMNTKTLSIIIIVAGLALAAIGGYNLVF